MCTRRRRRPCDHPQSATTTTGEWRAESIGPRCLLFETRDGEIALGKFTRGAKILQRPAGFSGEFRRTE